MPFDLGALMQNPVASGVLAGIATHAYNAFTKGAELRLAREQLAQKDRELSDAREVKLTEIANTQTQRMYDELRGYCDRLERRQTEMESDMRALRASLGASEENRMLAQAEVHVFKSRCRFDGECGFKSGANIARDHLPAPAAPPIQVDVTAQVEVTP